MKIPKEQAILNMSPHHAPVARTHSGNRVVFETCDCFSNQIESEDQLFSSIGWDLINPATGPLYVEDAEPGDILRVEIVDIQIADQGVMTVAPKEGVLGDFITEEKTKVIQIRDGKALFNEKIQIDVKPMIGVIGTAPATEEISTGTPGDHGGNMDCKRIVKGSVLYLPVNVPGALLSMGDLHAVMADGEIVLCGLEIPGEVTVDIGVIKGLSLPLPMLSEGEHVMTIASALTLEEAGKKATVHMHRFLVEEVGIPNDEAGMLLSLVGDLRICQVVDPLMTTRMELPKWVLKQYDYQLK